MDIRRRSQSLDPTRRQRGVPSHAPVPVETRGPRSGPQTLPLTGPKPGSRADNLRKFFSKPSAHDRVIQAWAAIGEEPSRSPRGASGPLSGVVGSNRSDRDLVRVPLAGGMPRLSTSKNGYFEQATDAVGRVLGVSRKRFLKEWDQGDPLGPDPETLASWRRNGLPLGPGYGPIVSPFTNIAFRGVPSVLDFGARVLSSAFHGGISGIGQAVRELGASQGSSRRFERDMRAFPEALAGLGSLWGRGPNAVEQFTNWPGRSRRMPALVGKPKVGETRQSSVHPVDRLRKLAPDKHGREAAYVSNFRSVHPKELRDIQRHGLRPDPTGRGYQLEKLFVTNAEDAGFFSRAFYPPSGAPHHIVEAKIPSEVMKNVSRFRADGLDAIGVSVDDLQSIPVKFLNHSPAGKRR